MHCTYHAAVHCTHHAAVQAQLYKCEDQRYLITLIGRAKKKGLNVLRCPVFTENIRDGVLEYCARTRVQLF